MREKKDSIFNSDILQQTAHLSHEEFGLFIRIAMIEDDEKTRKRYENISGIYLNAYMKIEEQWKEDFKPYINDIKAMTDYSTIYTPAAKSRKGYNDLKAKLDKQNNTNTETTEDTEFIEQQNNELKELTFNTNYFINKRTYTATYKAEYENNVPTENDIADLEFNVDTEILIKLIKIGNAEEWKRHYEEILNELQAEQQLETETPFDCLESEETENENSNN